jgi:hypothetical protein
MPVLSQTTFVPDAPESFDRNYCATLLRIILIINLYYRPWIRFKRLFPISMKANVPLKACNVLLSCRTLSMVCRYVKAQTINSNKQPIRTTIVCDTRKVSLLILSLSLSLSLLCVCCATRTWLRLVDAYTARVTSCSISQPNPRASLVTFSCFQT